MRDFPVVGVEVENSSRCHLIQHYVHEALLDCFPKSKVQKKKDCITESTFTCILEERALCKQMFKIGRYVASLYIRVIVSGWKKSCNKISRVAGVEGPVDLGCNGGDAKGAEGPGCDPPIWHSVFGLGPHSKIEKYLKFRDRVCKHRRQVNGLIKLERNLWVSDKAD